MEFCTILEGVRGNVFALYKYLVDIVCFLYTYGHKLFGELIEFVWCFTTFNKNSFWVNYHYYWSSILTQNYSSVMLPYNSERL